MGLRIHLEPPDICQAAKMDSEIVSMLEGEFLFPLGLVWIDINLKAMVESNAKEEMIGINLYKLQKMNNKILFLKIDKRK